MGELETHLEELEQAGAAWSERIVQHQDFLRSALSQLQIAMVQQRDEFSNLHKLASGSSVSVSQLKSETSRLQQFVAGLRKDKSVLQNQVDQFSQLLSDLLSEHTRLRSEIADQRDSMALLRGGQAQARSEETSEPIPIAEQEPEQCRSSSSDSERAVSKDIAPLLDAIAQNYPYGTKLDALTLQVLSNSLGREVTEDEAVAAKQAMYCSVDGNYHVMSSICPETVRDEMLEQAREWLSAHGAFAVVRWREQFRKSLKLNSVETDFLPFARQYFLQQLHNPCIYGEGETALIVDAEALYLADSLADYRILWVEELVQCLQNGEPLTREEVLGRFVWLTVEHLLELELPEDEMLIRYEHGGREYWTLLSSLGFEADFPQVLEEAIEALDEEKAPVTLSSIAAKLEAEYGFTSFYDTYGLSDSAFKAIVDACTAESGRTWQRGFYQKEGGERPLDPADANDKAPLLDAFAQIYPYGAKFDALTLQVLSSSLGREVTEAEAVAARQAMYCAVDGNYHVMSSICPETVRDEMLEQAREWLSAHGAFAVVRWREQFRNSLKLDGLAMNFLAFARQYLLPQLPESCIDFEGDTTLIVDAQAPHLADSLADYRILWAEELVQYLRDVEPLTREEVLERFAWLTAEHLLELELPEDELLIRYEQGGREYWTLLSCLGFEEDFPQMLEEAIETLDEEKAPVTLSNIAAKLETECGFTNFYESYALSDSAFKAIVDVCTAESGRTWQRGFYQKEDGELPLDLADAYDATHPGVFHSENYYDFAVNNGYVRSLNKLQQLYLWRDLYRNFLQLDTEKWISINDFWILMLDEIEKLKLNYGPAWDVRSYGPSRELELIPELLEQCLGDNEFLPMERCFEKVRDQLHEFESIGISWTPRLLTSVCQSLPFCCPRDKFAVVNDSPCKKLVLAQLVPANAVDSIKSQGIVEYVLRVYKKKGYRLNTYDEVFARLQMDCVRYSCSSEVKKGIAKIYGYAPPPASR